MLYFRPMRLEGLARNARCTENFLQYKKVTIATVLTVGDHHNDRHLSLSDRQLSVSDRQ
jgi:hypothetical protein